MKTAVCLFKIIVLGALLSPVAQAQREAILQKCEIEVSQDMTIQFQAESIQSPERKETSGYTLYRDVIYKSGFHPPLKILTSGCVLFKGERIELDVTGLADPWIEPAEITLKLIKLDSYDNGNQPFMVLSVCFAKEGLSIMWLNG